MLFFFLHGPGGTGKTFVYNTLCHFLCGQIKIVICVAFSGIAALLGRTAHSIFKIPIEIHKTSVCNIRKNSVLGDLIRAADLIIWDEAPMQHHHIAEAVNRTFQDVRGSDALFGGLTVVFGGDFQQILPVIEKGSRPETVGACLQRCHIWSSLQVLHLHQNMCLNVEVEQEKNFAQWQLDIGHGMHTDELCNIKLLDCMKLEENTVEALIHHIYPGRIGVNALDTEAGDHHGLEQTHGRLMDIFKQPGTQTFCCQQEQVWPSVQRTLIMEQMAFSVLDLIPFALD